MWKEYVLFIVLFLVIDSLWLRGAYTLHLQTYRKVTNTQGAIDLNKTAAFMFYALAPLGYFVFVQPLAKNDPVLTFQYGSLLGLLMYASYDLTSKAIYNQAYDWSYACMDMAWGAFVFGFVSWSLLIVQQYV